jgi:antitoxin CptB
MLFSRSELIKKLKYRSANRGCKELDIIIGNFAVSMLDEMSDQDLLTYQQLLEIEDNDFYNLFVQHINGQQSDNCPVLKQIVDFVAKYRG